MTFDRTDVSGAVFSGAILLDQARITSILSEGTLIEGGAARAWLLDAATQPCLPGRPSANLSDVVFVPAAVIKDEEKLGLDTSGLNREVTGMLCTAINATGLSAYVRWHP